MSKLPDVISDSGLESNPDAMIQDLLPLSLIPRISASQPRGHLDGSLPLAGLYPLPESPPSIRNNSSLSHR